MTKNIFLMISGALAILTAIYHAITGDSILQTLQITPAEQAEFVRSTYQLGSMGWMAGGVLLIAAATFDSQKARNWIVGVFVVIYGFPAFGTLALTGGQLSIGGVALALVVIFALLGRKKSPQTAI